MRICPQIEVFQKVGRGDDEAILILFFFVFFVFFMFLFWFCEGKSLLFCCFWIFFFLYFTAEKKGSVVQRNYTLNDVGALKKKVKWETSRKLDFALGKEAKNGCNISLLMKVSFFEMVKELFIPDLEEEENILCVENGAAAKASTEMSGDAYVEYSMEITFKADENKHTIKLTAYSTSCSIMIQQVGEPPEPKE